MIRLRHAAMISSLLLAASVVPAVAAVPDYNEDPNYGTVNLRTGFLPDPNVIAVSSGGDMNAAGIGGNCTGFISNSPDVRLVYSSGQLPLIISVDSGADTTLVVNAPDGSWHCDDDGGVSGLNPSIRFNRPHSGRYEIWVGTYGGRTLQPARLHISEVRSQ